MRELLAIFALALGGSSAAAVPFRVMSLNLHGYHPQGEAPRYLEARDGTRWVAAPDIYYFSREELSRGHRRRLDALAGELERLAPDLLVLQEVGASTPERPKDCAAFYSAREGDGDGVNAALRLYRRLAPGTHSLALVCRGNTGWTTDAAKFRDVRVVKPVGRRFEVVHDFGANPYPQGILVEGFAALVRKPWRIAEVRRFELTTNARGDRFVGQFLVLERNLSSKGTLRVLAVNLHAGHKLAHFEQAVALREALGAEVERLETSKGQRREPLAGVVVMGDFNAQLYRPGEGHGEVAMGPWELRWGEDYDFTRPSSAQLMKDRLWELNFDESYKPWATVRDPAEARGRIEAAVDRHFRSLRQWNAQLTESLWKSGALGSCEEPRLLNCLAPDRIDHIFIDERVGLRVAGLFQSGNPKAPLTGFSDHPGAWADLEL